MDCIIRIMTKKCDKGLPVCVVCENIIRHRELILKTNSLSTGRIEVHLCESCISKCPMDLQRMIINNADRSDGEVLNTIVVKALKGIHGRLDLNKEYVLLLDEGLFKKFPVEKTDLFLEFSKSSIYAFKNGRIIPKGT